MNILHTVCWIQTAVMAATNENHCVFKNKQGDILVLINASS